MRILNSHFHLDLDLLLALHCRVPETMSNQGVKSVRCRQQLPKGVLRGCAECADCQKVIARWNPSGARRPVLEEAPVYYPSEEEFNDTLKYIESIRPTAEQYGICRIVPPPSWKPPCLLKEKNKWECSKFSTRVQKVDKLQNRKSSKKTRGSGMMKKRRKVSEPEDIGSINHNQTGMHQSPERFGFEPGPEFTLQTFKKYADDFSDQYFNKDACGDLPPSVEDIEGEYWRIVESPTEEIEVIYGADLETGTFGSGFPKFSPEVKSDGEHKYAESGWNINNLPRLQGSVLSFEGGDISGVLIPWVYVGMCFSSFCWHVEDHHLYSLNYMHWGAPKMWYGVPRKDAVNLEVAMRKHLPDLFEEQPDLLHNLFECREFRESILGVMPHHWDRREDTTLQLAHFRKHKRKQVKKTQGKAVINSLNKPIEHNPPGKDASNRIARALGKAADMASSNKARKTQRAMYIPTITNHTQVWWVPNVIVAHEKEGIEAVHLASGRTICKLHLTEGGLHADINGDGVLDHVQVVGGNGIKEQTVVSGSMEVLKPCWAVATSGVPVREQLFNVSICHYNHFNLFHHGDFSRSFGRKLDTTGLEVATPILVQTDDGHKHRRGSHGDIVFLTSQGEVTSYSPGLLSHDAVWRWQVSTGATWSNLPSPSGMMENIVVPTLKSFSLRAYDPKEVIIAGGDQEAVVLSPSGAILAIIELPAPPTHALILEDFSGDGLTDMVVVTSGGVYGFVQTRQPGALFFSTLVGCLIVVIGVIFVSLHLNSSGSGKPRASSAEYR